MNLARSSFTALLGATLATATAAQTPLLHIQGSETGSDLGKAVAAPGDLDGDGVTDVAVGLPFATGPAGTTGAVQAYSGADGGLLWTTFGTAGNDQFGTAVEKVGDTDGDLVPDVLVGAPWNDDAAGAAGACYLLSGTDGAVLRTLLGTASLDRFGASATGMGDLDGDGRADYAIGAPGADSVNGSATGAVLTFSADGTLLGVIPGPAPGSKFGEAVAGVDDANGDGLGEVLVGAPFEATNGPNSGAAYLFDHAGGPPIRVWLGPAANAQQGTSLAGLGDLDGDGFEEYAVGAHADATGGTVTGGVRIYSGADGLMLFPPIYGQTGDGFGWDVSKAGDLTGDGVPDLVVGAYISDGNGTDSGRVAIVSGGSGLEVATYYGLHPDARLGNSVDAIGDLNSDGTPDFLVGSFQEDGAGPGTATGAAWVFSGVDCPPTLYCTAKTNSQGCVPEIATTGVPLASGGADDFHVTASNVLSQSNGLLLIGLAPGAIPFKGGTLCITPPTNRTALQYSGGNPGTADCSGTYDLHFTQALMTAKGLAAGTTLYAQYVSRDKGFSAPKDIGLTNAMSVTFCP